MITKLFFLIFVNTTVVRHFMTLYHNLIAAFLAFSCVCCGQDTKEFKRENKSVTVSFDSTYFKKLVLTKSESDSIFNIFRDSSIFEKAIYKKMSPSTADWDVGEFVSSVYKFQMDVQPIGWINDFEFILTPLEELKLDSIIRSYEKETSIELTVITIDKSWVSERDFDSLITTFHNSWGVGKKNKNNGIVIGLSKGHRKIRISNGYGIEQILSDDETKKIIDEIIVPEFKREMYYEGLRKGILTITAKVR